MNAAWRVTAGTEQHDSPNRYRTGANNARTASVVAQGPGTPSARRPRANDSTLALPPPLVQCLRNTLRRPDGADPNLLVRWAQMDRLSRLAGAGSAGVLLWLLSVVAVGKGRVSSTLSAATAVAWLTLLWGFPPRQPRACGIEVCPAGVRLRVGRTTSSRRCAPGPHSLHVAPQHFTNGSYVLESLWGGTHNQATRDTQLMHCPCHNHSLRNCQHAGPGSHPCPGNRRHSTRGCQPWARARTYR